MKSLLQKKSGAFNSAALAALSLVLIYGALDLIVPDPHSLKTPTLLNKANRVNHMAGRALMRAHDKSMGDRSIASPQNDVGENQEFAPGGSGKNVQLQKPNSQSNPFRSDKAAKSLAENAGAQNTGVKSDGAQNAEDNPVLTDQDSKPGLSEKLKIRADGDGPKELQDSPATGPNLASIGENNGQKIKKPDPTLVSEAALMAIVSLGKFALILGVLGFIFWFFTRAPVVKGPTKVVSRLTKEQKSLIKSELEKILAIKFNGKDSIIWSYNVFLKIMAAAEVPREGFVPPVDYSTGLGKMWPRYKEKFDTLTCIFSDTLYGNITVSPERVTQYEGAFRAIVKGFFR